MRRWAKRFIRLVLNTSLYSSNGVFGAHCKTSGWCENVSCLLELFARMSNYVNRKMKMAYDKFREMNLQALFWHKSIHGKITNQTDHKLHLVWPTYHRCTNLSGYSNKTLKNHTLQLVSLTIVLVELENAG